MKLNMKLSEKDAKLLFILFTVIILGASYFFLYSPNMSKAEELDSGNQLLQTRINELGALESQREAREKEIAAYAEKSGEIVNSFPTAMTTEKIIEILNILEESVGVEISSESFVPGVLFYPDPAKVAADAAAAVAAEEAAKESGEAAAPTTAPAPVVPAAQVLGYRFVATITIRTNYEELRRTMEFFRAYHGAIGVDSLSVAYDASTGELSGTMTLAFYSILMGSGEEEDRAYQPPVIDGVATGVDNIFGAMTIPPEAAKDQPEEEAASAKKTESAKKKARDE